MHAFGGEQQLKLGSSFTGAELSGTFVGSGSATMLDNTVQ